MHERVVLPTLDDKGLEARVSEHFGRASYFTVVDLDEGGEVLAVTVVANSQEHFGGQGRPKDQILALGPQVVIARDMGPRALDGFQEAGVTVMRSDAGTVAQALSLYREKKLPVLTGGCSHHRHG
ncbi:MAG: NifB/NifX family molybdenum-iron cluster-binding protein [Candidatus Caldatribacteriaceae bacterium]